MGPAGNASSFPASAWPHHSGKGPWWQVTRDPPSDTAPPALADHTLLFSHNPHEMQK